MDSKEHILDEIPAKSAEQYLLSELPKKKVSGELNQIDRLS